MKLKLKLQELLVKLFFLLYEENFSFKIGKVSVAPKVSKAINAWCPQEGHTYLNKPANESCRFI